MIELARISIRIWFLGFWVALFFLSCAVSAAQVAYNKLVAANCLTPSQDGVEAIAAEHDDPSQPAWFSCLYDGGSVQACNVPCQ